MSNSHHNASMQAQAARESAAHTARATVIAAQRQIDHDKSVREAHDAKLAECIESFASLDESSLFRKSDKDLAHFQATHPAESPQYALALNERNRRLVTRQVKATRFSAIVGLIGIVIGSILGWILASYSFKQSHQQFIDYISKSQVQDKAGQQPNQQLLGKNPDHVAPKTSNQPHTDSSK